MIDMILSFKRTDFFTLCQKQRYVSLLINHFDVKRGISYNKELMAVEQLVKINLLRATGSMSPKII